MFTPHNRCRACGYGPLPNSSYFKAGESKEVLTSVLDLGPMPLANSFTAGNNPRPGYYPLHLMVCPRCTLGQLSVTVDPRTLYSHYLYVTSASQTMDDHFIKLYDWLRHLEAFESVIEIGSNDGRLLRRFRELGSKMVLGIDPAQNLAKIANDSGVQTIARMFDSEAAEEASVCMANGGADLILARHVFCHIDDWKGFLHNAATMAHDNTILCIEAPWAHDMLANCEWDTIYHEHLSYFTLRAMQKAIEGTGWKLHAVRRFPVHGGALAVVLRRAGHAEGATESVDDFLAQENCSLAAWKQFAERARDQMLNLNLLITELRGQGKTIAGYGATAKATTWTGALHLTRSKIYGFYDCTTLKFYTTVPGSDIPVLPEGGFYVENPAYAIIWAWNFAEEIVKKNQKWLEGGGKFIVPVPQPTIVTKVEDLWSSV